MQANQARELQLQWGRVLMNAETARDTGEVCVFWRASMGPRSHERGNPIGYWCLPETFPALQWGRVLMNAETMGPELLNGLSTASFNGAAFS